jgi:hypothetical protein
MAVFRDVSATSVSLRYASFLLALLTAYKLSLIGVKGTPADLAGTPPRPRLALSIFCAGRASSVPCALILGF